MKSRYPIKEKILAHMPIFRIGMFNIMMKFKEQAMPRWKKFGPALQFTALILLVDDISDLYKKPVLHFEAGNRYTYDRATQTIMYDCNHPSIVSFLHELGHHLFGPSELKACRFSVWLLILFLPNVYNKLHWDGHMLKK